MLDEQVIFRYPDQKFVGLARRLPDKTLDHFAFALVNVLPKVGETIRDRKIVELLIDEGLLNELTLRARVDKIEAVAVLGPPSL